MNVKRLKEIIKDLPDDMEVKVYDGYWDEYQPLREITVISEGEGEFLGMA